MAAQHKQGGPAAPQPADCIPSPQQQHARRRLGCTAILCYVTHMQTSVHAPVVKVITRVAEVGIPLHRYRGG